MNGGAYSEVDFESDFEYEPEWDEGAEFEPEAPRTRRAPTRRYRTPTQPAGGTGRAYTQPPAVRTPVTHEQLRQALVRVKQDIDRVATGVRATNANVNDLAGRTTRNLNRLRELQQRDTARLERSVAGARELAILGAVLSGDGDVLLPLLVIGMDQQQPVAGMPAEGGSSILGSGSNNSTLLLALAAAGGFGRD
jgi:hypothetical protein